MKKNLFLAAVTAATISAIMPVHAQGGAAQGADQRQTTTTQAEITVGGTCGMCKTRIENAVGRIDGVSSASWDVRSKKLTLSFDASKTTLEAIGKALADVGHDNDFQRADDAVYNNMHGCCKYRR